MVSGDDMMVRLNIELLRIHRKTKSIRPQAEKLESRRLNVEDVSIKGYV